MKYLLCILLLLCSIGLGFLTYAAGFRAVELYHLHRDEHCMVAAMLSLCTGGLSFCLAAIATLVVWPVQKDPPAGTP